MRSLDPVESDYLASIVIFGNSRFFELRVQTAALNSEAPSAIIANGGLLLGSDCICTDFGRPLTIYPSCVKR
jgi:hypothetical protein